MNEDALRCCCFITPAHRSQSASAKHFRNRLLLSETTIFKPTFVQLLVGMERQELLLGATKILMPPPSSSIARHAACLPMSGARSLIT
jgi:hypothetical protein